MDHQSLEDSDSELSLFERRSTYFCLDRRIVSTTLFLIFLNLFHNLSILLGCRFICSFTFRISFLIAVVIQGGSDGLILTVLYGTHSAVREFI